MATLPQPTQPGVLGQPPTYQLPSQQNPSANAALQGMEQARQSAQQANESRYQDILGKQNQLSQTQTQNISGIPQEFRDIAGAYGQRTQDIGGMLGSLGQAQRGQLQDQYTKQQASIQQDLIRRGLTNSTALDSAQRGASSDYQKNLLNLEDMLTRQKVDVMGKLTGEELQSRTLAPKAQMDVAQQSFEFGQAPLGFMERRTDSGPTLQDVAGLSTAVGAGRTAVPDYLSGLGGSTTTAPTPTVPGGPSGPAGGGGGGGVPGTSGRSPTSPNTGAGSYGTPNISPYMPSGQMGPSLGSGVSRSTVGGGGGGMGGGGGGGEGGTGLEQMGGGGGGQQPGAGGQASGGIGSMYKGAVEGQNSMVVPAELWKDMDANPQKYQGMSTKDALDAWNKEQGLPPTAMPEGGVTDSPGPGQQAPAPGGQASPQAGYTGGGVWIPGFPYPVNPRSLSLEEKKKYAPQLV